MYMCEMWDAYRAKQCRVKHTNGHSVLCMVFFSLLSFREALIAAAAAAAAVAVAVFRRKRI